MKTKTKLNEQTIEIRDGREMFEAVQPVEAWPTRAGDDRRDLLYVGPYVASRIVTHGLCGQRSLRRAEGAIQPPA